MEQLVQRLYDVDSGEVLLDGKPISSYNLPWLRQRMGIVSQEVCASVSLYC